MEAIRFTQTTNRQNFQTFNYQHYPQTYRQSSLPPTARSSPVTPLLPRYQRENTPIAPIPPNFRNFGDQWMYQRLVQSRSGAQQITPPYQPVQVLQPTPSTPQLSASVAPPPRPPIAEPSPAEEPRSRTEHRSANRGTRRGRQVRNLVRATQIANGKRDASKARRREALRVVWQAKNHIRRIERLGPRGKQNHSAMNCICRVFNVEKNQ